MTRKLRAAQGAVLTAVLLAAGGCAGTGTSRPENDRLSQLGYQRGAEVQEIQGFRVGGYNVVDEKRVIVDAGPSERYLLTLKQTCLGLTTAENVGFSTTAQRLTRLDQIETRGPSGLRETCQIDTIHRLEQRPANTAPAS